jgi:hypothetical protein
MDEAPIKKILSLNFNRALLFLLDFLTLEAGGDRLPQNVSMELPLYNVQYLRRTQISHDNLAMQALVWHCMVQFRPIWFAAVRFGTSYMNLRRPHISKRQI